MPSGDLARNLERRARELRPTALFRSQDGKPVEYHRREQREIGAVEVHHLTLGQHLSYHSSTNYAGKEGCILGVRAEGNPYMYAD
jgi:hypothetical protein